MGARQRVGVRRRPRLPAIRVHFWRHPRSSRQLFLERAHPPFALPKLHRREIWGVVWVGVERAAEGQSGAGRRRVFERKLPHKYQRALGPRDPRWLQIWGPCFRTPQILHPQPSTLSTQPSTLNPQPSILNHQL